MPSLDDVLNKLRATALDLSRIDLWPPWDAAQQIVDAISAAVELANTPPPPDPTAVRAAATDWTVIGRTAGRGQDALLDLRSHMTQDQWQGSSGESFRSSVDAFASRADTLRPAADGVASALTTLEAEMTAARSRHDRAFLDLSEHSIISWSGLIIPNELHGKLVGIIEQAIKAIYEVVGSYEDALEAHSAAKEAIWAAMDLIDLPTALPQGASAIDAVSEWEAHDGPLAGDVIDRYNLAFGELSPEERAAMHKAMAGANSDTERAWIMAGVAAGLTGAALANYVKRLRTLTTDQLDDLDPTKTPITQPNGQTCGSSSLVMARMRNDPAYAMWILTGYNPETGETDPPQHKKETLEQAQERRFGYEAEMMHDRTNADTDRDGDPQQAFPKEIGTAPWAVANEMSADGGSGKPGTDYGVTTVDPDDRRSSYEELTAAVEDGHSVPLYVGNSVLPEHIVLVTGSDRGTLTVYDPGTGAIVAVTREQYLNGELPFGEPAFPLGLAGNMTEPYFIVVPK